VGPYLIDCRPDGEWDPDRHAHQAEEHGSWGYGQHGSWDGWATGREHIYPQCVAAVRRCDIFAAYIDGPDCYGTLIELGWALLLEKHICLMVAPDQPHLGDLLPRRLKFSSDYWPATDIGPVSPATALPLLLLAAIADFEHAQLTTMPYAAYLKTAHWQDVRQRALGRAEGRCQLCGTAGSLDVHHNTYERRGKERPSDVIALCRTCHAKHHDAPVGGGRRKR
jgi:hypothetical protein